MKVLKEYEIPYLGLKEGIHEYAFDIDAEFFESFEYSEVKKGKIHVDVSMDRQERMMIFLFSITGHVELPCDRCLAPMELEVSGNERLIVKLGQEWREESDEVLVIPDTESMINISSFIYEYIMLLIPFKRVHPEGEDLCDRNMIEKLEQFNNTGVDPRWQALEELKNKMDR